MEANDNLKNGEEEWTQWCFENPFAFKRTTTAIIKWRESHKQYETTITTKKYKYHSWYGSSDEDDEGPEIIQTDYKFTRKEICVIPQIGLLAGIAQKWVYNKPGDLQYLTKAAITPNIYVTSESIPSIGSLINSILRYSHKLKKESTVTLRSQLNHNYIQTPIALKYESFCRWFKIQQPVIGQIILKYLGVLQILIDFIPEHIFKPITIDVVSGMEPDEIKSLLITKLFITYPNLNSVPAFLWYYDAKGIDKYSKRRMIRKNRYHDVFDPETQRKYIAVLDHIQLDHFGLSNDTDNKACVVLNIVGFGYKTIYFKDFKSIYFRDLVEEFYNFTKLSKDNMANEIIAIYPHKNEVKLFHPRTRYRSGGSQQETAVYPAQQSKPFMTFDHDKYKTLLNKTLFDLKLDINGSLIEIYCVTGPCISVCFASMVGDSRIMDVNFDWNIQVFKMYAAKFGHGKSFHIESLQKEHQTLGDICEKFQKRGRGQVICRY